MTTAAAREGTRSQNTKINLRHKKRACFGVRFLIPGHMIRARQDAENQAPPVEKNAGDKNFFQRKRYKPTKKVVILRGAQ